MDSDKLFWKKYVEADDLERRKLMDELTIPDLEKGIVQSYFDDLIAYLSERGKSVGGEQ